MTEIASFEEDIKLYQEQLDVVTVGLKDDPGNPELLALKADTCPEAQGAISAGPREVVA